MNGETEKPVPGPGLETPTTNGSTDTADATESARIAALVAALQAENAELKDRSLRVLAEMENLRRRTEREVHDARSYGISKFALDILGVADNLRRALDALPPAEEYIADAPVKALLDGIELTERELIKALDRHGVKKREPLGEKFDPNKDQAMYEVPDESRPSGTIVQVVQAGYMIGERVLRPTLVGVSKARPGAEPAKPIIDKTA